MPVVGILLKIENDDVPIKYTGNKKMRLAKSGANKIRVSTLLLNIRVNDVWKNVLIINPLSRLLH